MVQAAGAAQAQASAQAQPGPQLHWLGAASQPQGGGHWQGLQLQSVFIGSSLFRVVDDRRSMGPRNRALERNRYAIRSWAGATPNMRRKVRLKWAESAKPASCAASVRLPPAATVSTARVSRSHSR